MPFDPDAYLAKPAEPSPAPSIPDSHWEGFYANPDAVNPTRMAAINQNYWSSRMPGTSADVLRNNWPSARLAIARQLSGKNAADAIEFGISNDVSEEQLFKLTAKEIAEEKSASSMSGVQAGIWAQHRHQMSENANGFWQIINKPLKELPEAPAMPNIPVLGGNNPALWAGAWNGIKPILEGVASTAGLMTMGAAGGLHAAAKEFPAARAALVGLSGLFTGMMGKGTLQAYDEWKRVIANPQSTFQDKAQAFFHVNAMALTTLLSALGGVESINPKPLRELPGKTPEEASAHLQEAAVVAKTPEEKQALHTAAAELNKISEPQRIAPGMNPGEPEAVSDMPGPPVEESPTARKTVTPKEASLAGIKNAVVDEEMKGMGLEPAEHGPALPVAKAVAWADAELAKDPMAGQKLIKDLGENPRPITGEEDMLLLTEVNRRKLERDAAESDLLAARQSGAGPAIAEARLRVAKARDDYVEAEGVATRVGTPQAQGLALRRYMMREDYSIASMESQLVKANEGRPITPEQEETVRSLAQQIREGQKNLDQYMARRVKAYKTRTQHAAEDLARKTALGDLSPKEKPPPLQYDEEALALKGELERVKQAFETEVLKARLANRSPWQKGMDTLVKWRRGFLLSGPVTLAKLTAAAIQRMVFIPAEEVAGAGLGKIPGVSKVMQMAPREGGINAHAEALAITQAVTQGMKDAGDLLRTGKGNLDVVFGHGADSAIREWDILPRSFIDFFGNVHGALKSPVKRAEFARSFEKRVEWNIRNGVDVSDPLVQTRIAVEAYKDANRSIFLQSNVVVDAYNRALQRLEQPDKATGKPTPAGKTIATGARVLLPIVRVPTNIVAETIQYATGAVTGSVRLGNAFRKGIENLSPEQADLIARELKKGTLGTAVLLAGYFGADYIGGYYQPGQKRGAQDVPFDSIKINGVVIPSYLMHNPLLEVLQIGATVHRVADSKLRQRDTENRGIVSGSWAAAMGLIEEVPFAREPVELGKVMEGGPEGQYATGNLLAGLTVPQLIQWIARQTDRNSRGMIRRQPKTIEQHIEAGIPGLRQKVPQRREFSLRNQ